MARHIPRVAISLGGNKRMIVPIILRRFPPGAFAFVSVGNPPVQEGLHIDTGSDLTWVLYDPHSGYGYDPLKSASFNYRSCDGLYKSRSVTPSKIRGQCNYTQMLADNAVYEGTLGIETFTFETTDWGLSVLKNVLFGFGKTVAEEQVGTGTLGLNLGELSIVSKFGGKFSICIGNFNRIRLTKHFLALGDDAVFVGSKVALDTKEEAYKINLSSVIINRKSLGLENILSKSKSILDTGTSTISLVREVYNVVLENIKEKMDDAEYDESDIYEMHGMTCYEGTVPEDTDVDLQLTLKIDEVRLHIYTSALFFKIDDDRFCLSVKESPIRDNLIGIPFFQEHNVGFHIPSKKLYIEPANCSKLYYNYYKDGELDHPTP